MTDDKYKSDCERCRSSKHSDGASHGWLFWGDDPYIKCEWCGEIRDALTGRVMTDASGQRCGPDENGMVVDPMSQRCGNCLWYRELYSNGDCEYPLPQWVKFVLSHTYNNVFPLEILAPFTVSPDEGKDCPTWQAK